MGDHDGHGDEQRWRDDHDTPPPDEPERSAADREAEVRATSLAFGIGIGMVLGAVLGVLLDSIGLGVGVGIALGAGVSGFVDLSKPFRR